MAPGRDITKLHGSIDRLVLIHWPFYTKYLLGTMMRSSLCSAFTTILACVLIAHTTKALVVHVPHEDEVCFIFRTPNKDSTVSCSFDLLDDNLSPDPVSILILDDDLETLYRTEKGLPSGQFSIHIQGRLFICIQNGLDHVGQDQLSRGVCL
jgi:hypothetical protein